MKTEIKQISTKDIIKCPHCGYEYLPTEIYVPGQIFGRPSVRDLVKDPLGKILYKEYSKGNEPAPVERFVCDGCKKTFVVEASVSFTSKTEEEELDFSDLTTSLLD